MNQAVEVRSPLGKDQKRAIEIRYYSATTIALYHRKQPLNPAYSVSPGSQLIALALWER